MWQRIDQVRVCLWVVCVGGRGRGSSTRLVSWTLDASSLRLLNSPCMLQLSNFYTILPPLPVVLHTFLISHGEQCSPGDLWMRFIESGGVIWFQDAPFELPEIPGWTKGQFFFYTHPEGLIFRKMDWSQTRLWILKYSEILQAGCKTISNLELAAMGVFTTHIGKWHKFGVVFSKL